MQKYVFRKYSSKYKDFFNSEKKKIIKNLGSRSKIEHVGSTAITKLGGKGIVDIAIGVSKLELLKVKNKLEEVGYKFSEAASCPKRLFFKAEYLYNNKKRRVHIHLMEFDSQNWQEIIGFRDYLLKNPDIVKQYIKIKKEAIKKSLGDGENYRKYKEKFIENILNKIFK